MTTLLRWLSVASFTFALLTPFALAQQDDRPLGDIAGEVRAQKTGQPSITVHRQGTAPSEDQDAANSPRVGQPASIDRAPTPAPSATDVRVVPAGTKIEIDLFNQNVAWPVRSGFDELIPALAKISFESRLVYPEYYDARFVQTLPPQKVVRLTSITIGDRSFAVDTNTVTVAETDREVTLTLSTPLLIPR